MSNLKYLASFIFILISLISCIESDNNNDLELNNNDGIIDEAERAIITECSENRFTSKSEIENNLIGEWELIGHGNSIFQDEREPRIELTISNDDLIIEYQDEHIDWIDTITWEVEEHNTATGQYFSLETEPEISQLTIYNFCENYMYLEISPIVADPAMMYLYQKVN